MLQKILDEKGVNKFFAYHEERASSTVTEFGWVESEDISLLGPIVISQPENNPSNATTLRDYEVYFNKLTSLTPDEFITKWEGAEEELGRYWKNMYKAAKDDQHIFFLKIALLVRNKISFEMYGAKFEVFE